MNIKLFPLNHWREWLDNSLDILLRVICLLHLCPELIFSDFHFLNLILVIEPHDLGRELDRGEKHLRLLVFDLILFNLSLADECEEFLEPLGDNPLVSHNAV